MTGACCEDRVGGPEAVHDADVMVVLVRRASVMEICEEVPADHIKCRWAPVFFFDDGLTKSAVVVGME